MNQDQYNLDRSRRLSEISSDEVAEIFRLLKQETQGHHDGRPAGATLRRYAEDELAVRLTTTETELQRLRQVPNANADKPRREVDELRRDRRLAATSPPTTTAVKSRTWFCGRAAASG
jgi:hypothetical protein